MKKNEWPHFGRYIVVHVSKKTSTLFTIRNNNKKKFAAPKKNKQSEEKKRMKKNQKNSPLRKRIHLLKLVTTVTSLDFICRTKPDVNTLQIETIKTPSGKRAFL